ncbi:MAG: hypothetical protein WDN01_19230 [Rhizomicrobium sp.]
MTMFARALVLSALIAAPAAAADCSTGAIPDTPVLGTVAGKPFVPKETRIDVTRDGMEIDDAKFDKYTLSIMTDGIFNEMTVTMLVPLGKTPAGRVFRVLPTGDIGAQPAAAPGTPEVQGWGLELEAADVDTSFTQENAAIRVELGQKTGNTLAGKIHFCVPGQKADIAGSFKAALH